MELFDEQIEGIVLVGLGIEGVALDLLEVFGKAGVGREVAPQDEGVYKEADQPGGLRVLAAGKGRADEQVVLPRQPLEQCLVDGQQEHVGGDLLLAAGGLQPSRQCGGDGLVVLAAVEALNGRARAVGGQLQHRQLTG